MMSSFEFEHVVSSIKEAKKYLSQFFLQELMSFLESHEGRTSRLIEQSTEHVF